MMLKLKVRVCEAVQRKSQLKYIKIIVLLQRKLEQAYPESIVIGAKILDDGKRSAHSEKDHNECEGISPHKGTSHTSKFSGTHPISPKTGDDRDTTEGNYGEEKFQFDKTKKKILKNEENLVLEFFHSKRLIKNRRNAVCERRAHDRHELCANLRRFIIMESLKI